MESSGKENSGGCYCGSGNDKNNNSTNTCNDEKRK